MFDCPKFLQELGVPERSTGGVGVPVGVEPLGVEPLGVELMEGGLGEEELGLRLEEWE